ncbi:hypothetical protein EDB81DRAFT_784015 [Dactylonectria macrodidyma]|uniref:Uncharacterized protein n=1 Tax=Dactylonectria macrodidyma TaxID=307937 RepID=A0A9P9JC72_9HYPO|nr:hypothetical protein EDB81DRAFT_784015 [Dactylonectria macrodidyma]
MESEAVDQLLSMYERTLVFLNMGVYLSRTWAALYGIGATDWIMFIHICVHTLQTRKEYFDNTHTRHVVNMWQAVNHPQCRHRDLRSTTQSARSLRNDLHPARPPTDRSASTSPQGWRLPRRGRKKLRVLKERSWRRWTGDGFPGLRPTRARVAVGAAAPAYVR